MKVDCAVLLAVAASSSVLIAIVPAKGVTKVAAGAPANTSSPGNRGGRGGRPPAKGRRKRRTPEDFVRRLHDVFDRAVGDLRRGKVGQATGIRALLKILAGVRSLEEPHLVSHPAVIETAGLAGCFLVRLGPELCCDGGVEAQREMAHESARRLRAAAQASEIARLSYIPDLKLYECIWDVHQAIGEEDAAWASMEEARREGYCNVGGEKEGLCQGEEVLACPDKLDHDLQQLEYLLDVLRARAQDNGGSWNRTLETELRTRRSDYIEAMAWLQESVSSVRRKLLKRESSNFAVQFSCAPILYFPVVLRRSLARSYNQDVLPFLDDGGRSPVLIDRTDWSELESHFWREGYVIIDNLITEPALVQIFRYATESSAFTRMHDGYIGAFPPRIGPAEARALSDELLRVMPSVLKGLSLNYMWYYKYLQPRESAWRTSSRPSHVRGGIGVHTDEATVSFDIFINTEDAQLEGGGLRIFLCTPPLSGHNRVMGSDVKTCPDVTVPWKRNRAVVFVSSVPHNTEDFRFRAGFRTARINLSLLFGRVRTGPEYRPRVPAKYRERFFRAVFAPPPRSARRHLRRRKRRSERGDL